MRILKKAYGHSQKKESRILNNHNSAPLVKILYYLFRLSLSLLKIVPFIFLYGISDLICFLMYYIIRYRKDVVLNNLKCSFPEKSEVDIKKVAKGFYRNLSDILVESIKGYSMSQEKLTKRYKVNNSEIVNKYLGEGKTVIALASHYCNWEWGIEAVAPSFMNRVLALYQPVKNTYIDKYLSEKRKKGGMSLVPVFETRKSFEEAEENPALFIMAADQNPGNVEKAIWVNFLGRDTACLYGPEYYARKYDIPLVYFNVQREKRGYYNLIIKEICKHPATTEPGYITQLYMNTLVSIIREKPENWLWSHKRWKHKRNIENE